MEHIEKEKKPPMDYRQTIITFLMFFMLLFYQNYIMSIQTIRLNDEGHRRTMQINELRWDIVNSTNGLRFKITDQINDLRFEITNQTNDLRKTINLLQKEINDLKDELKKLKQSEPQS